jgi:trans-aconitate methyltransferase
MDTWKFYAITHQEHVLMNPTSESKLQALIELLRLKPGARVVDVGCGKGEFLVRLAQSYGVVGTGIDISPSCVADAIRAHRERAPTTTLTFVQADGASIATRSQTCDLASCLGASWIFGGYQGTLKALLATVADGGWILVGEPFWRAEPSAEYLRATNLERDSFGSHSANVAAGEALGLNAVYTMVSDPTDWDRYEDLQWNAAQQYGRENPDDPDVPELMERVAKHRTAFLRWGRDTLGWAMYAFRRGPTREATT